MESSGYELRCFRDCYAPGAMCDQPLPLMNRVLYCKTGTFTTCLGEACAYDQAWHGVDEVTITSGKDGAEVGRWEVAAVCSSPVVKLGGDVLTSLDLWGLVDSIDAGNQGLMRYDSVKFPPKGCAFTHTHQGQLSGCCVRAPFAPTQRAPRTTFPLAKLGLSLATNRFLSKRPSRAVAVLCG